MARSSGSLCALVAGASASIVGGLANGVSRFLVAQDMVSVGLLAGVLIGAGVVVLTTRIFLFPRIGTWTRFSPMAGGMAAGMVCAALLLLVGL
ncbi:hypothetical protein ACLQ3C_05995 [Gordonia sp. DT30]|uniref:hypothetical protein n=1 Tax=unclassified Gordonia (in: high G+C Gram-positive bacteria) TaxID=2657482 RepID=UPI003CF4A8F6